MTEQKDYAVCSFHLREEANKQDGVQLYQYTSLHLNNYQGDGHLYTLYPPVVGDTMLLIDKTQDIWGTFVVVTRDISYSQYGSYNWPYGEQHSNVAPAFTYIVERAVGPFRNEA